MKWQCGGNQWQWWVCSGSGYVVGGYVVVWWVCSGMVGGYVVVVLGMQWQWLSGWWVCKCSGGYVVVVVMRLVGMQQQRMYYIHYQRCIKIEHQNIFRTPTIDTILQLKWSCRSACLQPYCRCQHHYLTSSYGQIAFSSLLHSFAGIDVQWLELKETLHYRKKPVFAGPASSLPLQPMPLHE